MDPEIIKIIVKGAQEAFENGQWFGLIGFLLPIAIEIYKKNTTQNILEKVGLDFIAWDNLSEIWHTAIVAFVSAGATFCGSVVLGLGWTAAAWAAAPVMVVAIVTHVFGKSIGSALDTWLEQRKPQYMPGTIRKATTIFLPSKHPTITGKVE